MPYNDISDSVRLMIVDRVAGAATPGTIVVQKKELDLLSSKTNILLNNPENFIFKDQSYSCM